MNNKGLEQILQTINQQNNILIIIHEKPDADTLGSATALALYLKKKGKQCAVFSADKIPQRISFIKNDEVLYFEETIKENDFKYDYVYTIDVASFELITKTIKLITKPISLIIDHHRVNTLSGDIKYVDENSAATGEIIFNLIMLDSEKYLDKSICTALFSSISSDTGCFKYGNTTKESHRIASVLMEQDIPTEEINRCLFDTKNLSQINTEILGYKKMKLFYNNKLAITIIETKDLKKIGATDADTETLSQYMRMINGVQIGVLMKERILDDGSKAYKFSVRGNTSADVSLLCSNFAGGGHMKAAGCTITASKKKALDAFVKAAKDYIL